jgi:DUF4097 and DUF4098 domain-containing protein YvlB
MSRRRAKDEEFGSGSGGFGGFLRSLLSGIPWSEVAEREDRERFKAPAGGLLRIRNANGRIEVIGEDREDVLVEAGKRARAESQDEAARLLDAIRIAHQESAESLDLEVEVPRRWNRHGHVNLEVRVPRHLRLQCESVNGKLAVSGMRASVGARSSNGSVTVEDVVGNVDVFTANAKVACSCTCGALVARSSNGKIEIGEHRGSVDASTSNGLIRASLDALGPEGVRLATSNGRIVLELPDEVDADVDLRVDNGIVRNERELENATRSTDGRVRGSLGRGGAPIKLRTSNGSISLR